MLEVYTDISQAPKDKRAVGTAFLIDDDNYIGCHTYELTSSMTVSLEFESAMRSIAYARKIQPEGTVKLYCDNKLAVEIMLAQKDTNPALKDVIVSHIVAHAEEINPNKVADKISNRVLRYRR